MAAKDETVAAAPAKDEAAAPVKASTAGLIRISHNDFSDPLWVHPTALKEHLALGWRRAPETKAE